MIPFRHMSHVCTVYTKRRFNVCLQFSLLLRPFTSYVSTKILFSTFQTKTREKKLRKINVEQFLLLMPSLIYSTNFLSLNVTEANRKK